MTNNQRNKINFRPKKSTIPLKQKVKKSLFKRETESGKVIFSLLSLSLSLLKSEKITFPLFQKKS